MMMKSKIVKYYIFILGVLFANNLYAQQDTVPANKGFNALQYSLQKRYLPRGYKFNKGGFWNHVYISGQLGMEKIIRREGADINGGPAFSFSAGKLLNHAHSVRLSLKGGWFGHKLSDSKLYHVGIGASYLFNITSYIKGYDPYRLLEISTVSGIGYQVSAESGKTSQVGEMHLGAQLKFHLHQQVDLVLEPLVTLYTDGIDHYSQKNWHKYDVGYGATVGFIYRLKDPLSTFKKKGQATLESSFLDNAFISVAGGVQFQNSDFVKDMGILKSIGPHINLSFGKWYNGYWGLRLSGFYATDKWRQLSENNDYETTTYAGVRLEGMFDIMGLLHNSDRMKRFSLSLLLGPEIGNMKKIDSEYPIKTMYIGLSGGVQLKYNINKKLAVFIEPRGSYVPYSNLEPNPSDLYTKIRKKYNDNVFNLNAGIELKLGK